MTLEETIEQARQQSPDAQNARHSFRSAYWNYKYYCANYLPTLKLTSNPYLDRAINKVTQSDGNVKFIEQNLLSTDLTLSLTKTCRGPEELSLKTAAQRARLFSAVTLYSWQTSYRQHRIQPVLVWLQQPEVGPAHRTYPLSSQENPT